MQICEGTPNQWCFANMKTNKNGDDYSCNMQLQKKAVFVLISHKTWVQLAIDIF